ncbi:MAG: DUF2298 domain-containing protein [Chloroflexota bacterium]|nr:DUF2298 domain-containing protein [Chloroflexota bacterium]
MSQAEKPKKRTSGWWVGAYLVLILLTAFFLRVFHIDWADGHLPHPDERSTVAFYAPSIHLPPDGISLLDTRQSPLNPLWDVNKQSRRSYTYGHFPLYLVVLAANGLHELAPLAEGLGLPGELVETLRTANGVPGFALVGRLITAIADTFTVLLVFLLAQHIYGRRRWWVGLLAAGFSAFTVLQIQLSHFFAVDPISTAFTLLALYGALRLVELAQRGRVSWIWAVITGIGAGLAIASKFSALPVLAAPVVAGLMMLWRGRGFEATDLAGERPSSSQIALLVILALLVAVATFAVTSPFVLLDWENFNRAVLIEQGAMVRGEADFPFTRQYRGSVPYLYFLEQQVKWGIGWPLGLLCMVALMWVLVKVLRGRSLAGELIILSWVIPYFGMTGLFLAKFNRYMVPIVPLLMVFAAGLVAAIAGEVPRRANSPEPSVVAEDDAIVRQSSSRRWMAAIVGGAALLGAVLWSVAFVNGVYGQEHPFIRASRWMYDTIPDNSVWITEHWEEGLPLSLPEDDGNPGAHGWRNLTMPMYEEDTERKFETLRDNLREGDTYVLATKRLYGALPNLPERYPMSNRFYELLFAGQLGYELAAEFTSFPGLFGVEIDDQSADESFWVYDHPRTLIFRKVRDLSDAEWNALLGNSWAGARAWHVGEPTLIQRIWSVFDGQGVSRQPQELEESPDLLLDQPLDELPVVQDFRWNTAASRSVPLAVISWWLALFFIGLLVWPFAFSLFRNLRDRGYLFSRSLGWLTVGYGVWLAASLRIGQNSLAFILVVALGVAAVSFWFAWRNREEMAAFWRSRKGILIFGEALFGVAYLLFVVVRLLNPDLWQPWNGGEKFMEFAFLNAILRSANFPPIDPYFAGGTINYYYYGHYLVALLAKLTGIWSSVAFNLAVPTLFALTIVNVVSLGYTLAGRLSWRGTAEPVEQDSTVTKEQGIPSPGSGRRLDSFSGQPVSYGIGSGLLAAFFVALLGNVDGGGQMVRNLALAAGTGFESRLPGVQTAVGAVDGLVQVANGTARVRGYWYWDPSRVIPYTINEFPYWSFLFADLHPHMIGIPFTVLFLAMAYSMLVETSPKVLTMGATGRQWLTYGIRSLTGDGLFPAMALVLGALAVLNTWDLPTYFGLAVLVWLVREWRSGRLYRSPGRSLLRTVLFAILLLVLAIGLYLPFFLNYKAIAASGVGIVTTPTELGLWLNIWGFLGFLLVTYILVELRRKPGVGRARELPILRWLGISLDSLPGVPRLTKLTPRLSTSIYLILALIVALAVLLWSVDWRVPAVLLLPLFGVSLLLLRRQVSAARVFLSVLVFTALLVLFGVEIFYLKDHLQGGDYRRMNTLFKFYIQVWVMLGLALGVALPGIWRFIHERWRLGWRILWTIVFFYLLLLSLVFLFLGTSSRVNDRFPQQNGVPSIGTLDGMAYMQSGTYTWHPDPGQAPNSVIELGYDYQALRWMLENLEGTPLVAEAPIGYYREGGLRVSSFTGFPTFLGFHQEGEQRYGTQTGARRSLAEEFWRTTDLARARQLIDELKVDYIYVGQLEEIVVPPEGLAKFGQLAEQGDLEVVFQNDKVTIFRVV